MVLVFLLGGMVYASLGTAQDLLNKRVTIRAEKEDLKSVLQRLEKSAKVRFTYTSSMVRGQKVSLDARDQALDQVLKALLSPLRIQYSVSQDFIILERYRERKEGPGTPDPARVAPDEAGFPENGPPDRLVKGNVKDENNEPLPGVNVIVKGTWQGTITDAGGEFSLSVPGGESVIVCSFVGYVSREVVVGNRNYLEITLQEDKKALEEIVVIGYGTSKKGDLTGAISSIRAEELSAQAPRNVQDILRANAPGLNIGIATDAKAEASLSIRGKGTLTANNSPLIVLNNVIYEGALADINPMDIATVDVLKDASAAAVYGSRSANGVIVITTKKGKKGKPVITLSSNTGLAFSASQPKILDKDSFLKFRQDYNEGRNSESYLATYPQIFVNPFDLNGINRLDWYNYDQKTPVTSVNDEQLTTKWLSRLNLTTPEINNYFADNITRWDKLVFQRALQQDYNVSVSNATDRVSQYFSLGYTDREGVIVGDRYKNIRVRMNVESKITSFLTAGINTQFATRNEGYLKSDWGQMTMISPYGSNNIDDPESGYRRRPTGLDPINPFYDNLYTERIDRRQNIITTLYSKINLPFGIEYNLNFSPYYNWYEYYNHYSSRGDNWASVGGASTRTHSKRYNWQMDNIIRWKREFANVHRVEVTLLANAEKAQFWQTTANASNYSPNDILGYHRLQAGAVATVSSEDTYQTGNALMARVFYSLKDKYMLTASVRRDGYSAFGKKNPYAVFPSLAAGWVFSDEAFIHTNKWFNYGKLRFSWGENGNREIGQYAALSQMSSSLTPYIDRTGNVYSTSQIYVTTMANHNLKWERTASYNLGLDFGLLNNLLSGSAEAYVATTHDLLVSRALPDITGYQSVMSNLGQIQNKGFELTLTAHILKSGDYHWTATGNFSMNRRKIVSLYGDMVNVFDSQGNITGQKEADDLTNGWFIGQDPDRIWAYERAGVWQQSEKETAATYGLQPGDFKYIDQNGDGIMNNQDRVFQGYQTPRSRWSLRNEAGFRGITLSCMIYSNLNYYGAFQRAANNYAFPDRTSDYDFPRWTPATPVDDYARIGSKNIGTNWLNKSFIRLENITVSYNLPRKILESARIQDIRVSASLQNAGVFTTRWNFWDPESGTVTPRTLNFGINVTL